MGERLKSLEGKGGVSATQGHDTKNFCVGVLSSRSIFELRNTIFTCVRVVCHFNDAQEVRERMFFYN